ncbi:MAG: kelch repeat-containing protein [Acidobacteriota bacterium]
MNQQLHTSFTGQARARNSACFIVTTLLMSLLIGSFPAQGQTWSQTGSLATGRTLHTSTILANGKVLVAGGCPVPCPDFLKSAEVYNPATGQWSATGNMGTPRINHVTVRLPNGRVLVVGGDSGSPSRSRSRSAEIYDPATGAWNSTGDLITGRELATATLLPNGRVLVVGGSGPGNNLDALASAEIYDPATGSWSAAGTMNAARSAHTATLLANGKVLVASGAAGTYTNPILHSSAELYDPATGSWTPTGSLGTARPFHKAAMLSNGKVLVMGGSNFTSTIYEGAELYDPATGQWSATGSMATGRISHTATPLADGNILAAAGSDLTKGKRAELYDPATGNWTAAAELNVARFNHVATLLTTGRVIVVGGNGVPNSAELFDSGAAYVATVSAASYSIQNAANEIVAAFGQNFSSETAVAASIPLPTSLAGATVKIRDESGNERIAPLLFVSPGQINYQVPNGTLPGQAFVTVTASDGRAITGVIQIISAAPALFTVDASGTGAATALDAFTGAAAPFNATRVNGEPNIISIFATGLGADATDTDGNANASVLASIAGQAVTVLYAGRAPGFVGLNQLNLVLPAGITAGTYTLAVARDGVAGNSVTIAIK